MIESKSKCSVDLKTAYMNKTGDDLALHNAHNAMLLLFKSITNKNMLDHIDDILDVISYDKNDVFYFSFRALCAVEDESLDSKQTLSSMGLSIHTWLGKRTYKSSYAVRDLDFFINKRASMIYFEVHKSTPNSMEIVHRELVHDRFNLEPLKEFYDKF